MTGFAIIPRWGADDDWTCFLLLLVPVVQLPVPAWEVERALREQVEQDSAMYDLVALARAPGPEGFAGPADWVFFLADRS